jgi:hypothetical protein
VKVACVVVGVAGVHDGKVGWIDCFALILYCGWCTGTVVTLGVMQVKGSVCVAD